MKGNKKLRHELKKNKANDPNYLFDPIQFSEINRDFYRQYLDGYFAIKVNHLIKLSESSKNEKEELFEFELGDVKAYMTSDDSISDIGKYVNTEIVMTTFHCLETFVRMFIAHSALSDCPNLILSNLSIKEYHNNLNSIQKKKYNYMNRTMTDDEVIARTFYNGMENVEKHSKILNVSPQEILDGIKVYINYAVRFLKDNSEYNTYKHGFYLQQSEQGFIIKSDSSKLEGKGNAFTYVKSVESKNGKQWSKFTKWFDVEYLAQLTVVYSYYTGSLLKLWKYIYLGESDEGNEGIHIPRFLDLNEILKNEKNNSSLNFFSVNSDKGSDKIDFITNKSSINYRYFKEEFDR